MEEEFIGHAIWSFLGGSCVGALLIMPPLSLTIHPVYYPLTDVATLTSFRHQGQTLDVRNYILSSAYWIYYCRNSLPFIEATLNTLTMKNFVYRPRQIPPNHTSSSIESFEQ